MDDRDQLIVTLRGQLLAHDLRIKELEHMLRHFDGASMHLFHYANAIDGLPTQAEWQLVKDQLEEMVDPYGPRNPHGRS